MSQTKKQSLFESITNIIVGYSINLFMQMLIFPIFGIHISVKTNIYIGLCFTVISLIRSYFLRRLFNMISSKWGKNNKDKK